MVFFKVIYFLFCEHITYYGLHRISVSCDRTLRLQPIFPSKHNIVFCRNSCILMFFKPNNEVYHYSAVRQNS